MNTSSSMNMNPGLISSAEPSQNRTSNSAHSSTSNSMACGVSAFEGTVTANAGTTPRGMGMGMQQPAFNGIGLPGMMNPGMMNPGMMSPGMMPSGMMTQGMMPGASVGYGPYMSNAMCSPWMGVGNPWPMFSLQSAGSGSTTGMSVAVGRQDTDSVASKRKRGPGRPPGSKNRQKTPAGISTDDIPFSETVRDEARRLAVRRRSAAPPLPAKLPTGNMKVAFLKEDECVDCGIWVGTYLKFPCGHYPFCAKCCNEYIDNSENALKSVTCIHCKKVVREFKQLKL